MTESSSAPAFNAPAPLKEMRPIDTITPAPPAAPAPPRGEQRGHAVWGFVLTDLVVFGAYFVTFLWERSAHRSDFDRGASDLGLGSGLTNTVILLTSSLLIALAVDAVRCQRLRRACALALSTMICGLAFMVIKLLEWSSEASLGHGLSDGIYFQLYYLLTGLHFFHVLVGMVVLGYVVATTYRRRALASASNLHSIEGAAIYWHLVDAIWLALFTLFYLLR